MKLDFLKKLWSKIKRVRVEDILQILIVATVVMVVASVVNPKITAPWYAGGKVPITAANYFDIFVRYGTFAGLYFTLIPALIFWLAKKKFKEKWTRKTGFLFVISSVLVLTVAYFVVPGPIYGNPLNIPWSDSSSSKSDSESEGGGGFQKFTDNGHDFCGKRIDFFYSPACSTNKLTPDLETIKNKLESKGSEVEFDTWCLAGYESPCGTEGYTCEAYETGEYTLEDARKLFHEYSLETLPSLILGCKYIAAGQFDLEGYKELICEKFDECGL